MSFTEQFLSLIEEQQNEVVRSILEDGRLHHSVDTTGNTLLHHAAKYGNAELTKYLLSNGCNVDARNRSIGFTPLMSAVAKRKNTILQILLAAGADIDAENSFHETALDVALGLVPKSPRTVEILFHALKKKYSREEIAEWMVENAYILKFAVLLRDAQIIEYMIESGVTVEHPQAEDDFPLHLAVDLGEAEIVKVLLEYGTDIEGLNGVGATPLHHLYHFNFENTRERLEILKMLLSKRASLTTCTAHGYFQVSPTLIRGSDEAVRLVLQSGIDFTERDKRTRGTILHCIALNKNQGVVEVLRQHIDKFDINARDTRGYRPLHLAVKNGNVNMVKFLLDQGADVSGALFCAFSTTKLNLKELHDQCVEILLQHDADPQELYTYKSGRQRTIFDVFMEGNYSNRMQFALAQLAVGKEEGTPVTELTRLKLHSHTRFAAYFEKCRRLLRKKISGSVSFLELLTADENKMARYLNNSVLALKLARIGYNKELKSANWYYYSTLKKKFTKGIVTKNLRHKAADVIRQISKNRLGLRDIPTDVIIDNLSDTDLRRLLRGL